MYIFSSLYFFGTKEIAICIKLHKFATTNSNFLKINSFRHASSYNVHIYINFKQNRANRSVITVHTNVFAKKS